jgi:AmmeMemoRadiSam system protein A
MRPPEAWPAAGVLLLRLARLAIAEVLGAAADAAADEPWLRRSGASFVTLRRDGRLRGCIGTVRAFRPLGDDVRGNAVAAALRDPRFPPLSGGELPSTAIEVSLLSALAPVAAASEEEAVARLRPRIDGVLLEAELWRATFLPQVWEELPEPRSFLRQLRRKAGLPGDAWPKGTRLWRFTVRKIAEVS